METTERSEEEWAETLLTPKTDEAPLEDEAPEPEETAEVAEADDDEATADNDEETEADAVPEKPQRLTVKVDGKEVEVTLEELKRSYSEQSFIQNGMEEAAAAKKQAEQAYQALQNEQQRVLAFVQQAQTQGLVQPPTPPTAALAEKDPVAYIRAKARYDADVTAFQGQQYQIQQMQQQHQAAQDAAMRAHLESQAATLRERIPEFANPETAAKVREKLVKIGAEAYGYTADELMDVKDARAVQVLHDAMKYRELMASTATAKKTPDAPRTVKAAARRPEPAQLAQSKIVERAKKSGRVEDWAETLLIRK